MDNHHTTKSNNEDTKIKNEENNESEQGEVLNFLPSDKKLEEKMKKQKL